MMNAQATDTKSPNRSKSIWTAGQAILVAVILLIVIISLLLMWLVNILRDISMPHLRAEHSARN